jgi:hypothetical protein
VGRAELLEGEGLIASVLLGVIGLVVVRAAAHSNPSPRGRSLTSFLPPPPPKTSAQPAQPAPVKGPPSMSNTPGMVQWEPTIAHLIATEFPRVSEPFALMWGQIESGGNAAAVGDPGQLGQGSQQPAEIGLGQLYNPDDFKRYGVDPAAFRAYCPAAAPLAAQYNAAKAKHDTTTMNAIARQMQTLTRPLTQAEKDDQVRYTLLHKIDDGITIANNVVHADGLTWNQPDYWKLVKAPHAYPPILNQGMPAVVKKLGRAPSSWLEFRQALGMDLTDAQAKCQAGDANACLHWTWMRALNACEQCGNAVAPQGQAVT